ncbi:putative mucin-4-like [Ilyonectria robusta]
MCGHKTTISCTYPSKSSSAQAWSCYKILHSTEQSYRPPISVDVSCSSPASPTLRTLIKETEAQPSGIPTDEVLGQSVGDSPGQETHCENSIGETLKPLAIRRVDKTVASDVQLSRVSRAPQPASRFLVKRFATHAPHGGPDFSDLKGYRAPSPIYGMSSITLRRLPASSVKSRQDRQEHGVLISDDDSDDDSEVGTEYDCGVATGANVDDTSDDEAKDKASEGHQGHANGGDTRDGNIDDGEVSDDAAEDGNGSRSPTTDEDTNAGNDIDAGDDASAVGDSSDYKTRCGYDAVDAIAWDDTPVKDAIDSNVNDEPDDGDIADGVASNDATTVDEASNSDRNDGIDADIAIDAADSDRGVAVKLAAIRSWLDRLKAKLNPSSSISQATSPRGKRK